MDDTSGTGAGALKGPQPSCETAPRSESQPIADAHRFDRVSWRAFGDLAHCCPSSWA